MITITIATDNAAFEDANLEPEVARILKRLANTIAEQGLDRADGLVLRDLNGNRVGSLEITD
jgi:hypothetical protein